MFNSNDHDELSSFQIDDLTAAAEEDNIFAVADHIEKEPYQQDLVINNELLAAFYWHTNNNSTTDHRSANGDKGKGKVVETDRDPRGGKPKRISSSSAADADSSGTGVSWVNYNNPNQNILKPNHDHDTEDLSKKKILHRDIERQRRQDMSGLYSKLQTLLPTEYIEGRRSMSDHIWGSVNFIKHLKRRITDLQDKRDSLLKASEEGDSWTDFELFIQPSGAGYEVHIRVPLMAQGFPVSRALEVLLEEGLHTHNYSSTRVNKQFIHTIHCQVSKETNTRIDINAPRLRQRIYDACSRSS